MRILLFLLSALIALQAPQPAAAIAHAEWKVVAHDEQVLAARHIDVAKSVAQKRHAHSVRPATPHALPPETAQLAQPSAWLATAPAAEHSGIPRLRPHSYEATGPPAAA